MQAHTVIIYRDGGWEDAFSVTPPSSSKNWIAISFFVPQITENPIIADFTSYIHEKRSLEKNRTNDLWWNPPFNKKYKLAYFNHAVADAYIFPILKEANVNFEQFIYFVQSDTWLMTAAE